MQIDLDVKCPLFLPDFNKTLIFPTDFRKYANIKFHKNPSSVTRVVPCRGTDRHAETNSGFS
jgi:hypothetical protein